jgi:NTP pyrophosphatase (non-canonical NTP hydrolase)
MDAPVLPDDPQSCLQVQLTRWQAKNFGGANAFQMLAGVVEEVGELAHALLKHDQKIRGYDDDVKYREAAGDAIADAVVYLQQLCTLLRLDFGTLVSGTAYEVMKRDWTTNPGNAHEAWQSPSLDGTSPVCSDFKPSAVQGFCASCNRPTSAHPSITIT